MSISGYIAPNVESMQHYSRFTTSQNSLQYSTAKLLSQCCKIDTCDTAILVCSHMRGGWVTYANNSGTNIRMPVDHHHAPTSAHRPCSLPTCRAYVGSMEKAAGSYYDSDFVFEAHAAQVKASVAATTAEWERQHSSTHSTAAPRCIEYAAWETFHAQHDTAQFFKERRYITLAFPQLLMVISMRQGVCCSWQQCNIMLPVLCPCHTCPCCACPCHTYIHAGLC